MQAQSIQQLFARYKILALLLAVAAIWIFFHAATGGDFVTARNLSNLFRQMAITGMLACGVSQAFRYRLVTQSEIWISFCRAGIAATSASVYWSSSRKKAS